TLTLLAGGAGVTHQALAGKPGVPQAPATKPGGDRSAPPLAAKDDAPKPQALSSKPDAVDDVVFEGVVLDPNGKPVAGAQLSVCPGTFKEVALCPVRATTAKDGRFKFRIARAEYLILRGDYVRSFVQVVATAT